MLGKLENKHQQTMSKNLLYTQRCKKWQMASFNAQHEAASNTTQKPRMNGTEHVQDCVYDCECTRWLVIINAGVSR